MGAELKKILVVGASGFVGSHILEALQTCSGVQVIAACRHANKLPPGFKGEVRVGDLRDEGYRQSALTGVDVVCYAAAWTSLWGHAEQSRAEFLSPALAFIQQAKAAGVQRFINTSTTSAASPDHSADPMSTGICRPLWPHLCHVVEIEQALRQLASPVFQVVNLRLGVFVGKRYALGILPILVPRLKTHLVPWVASGRTSLPLLDGRDIGQAFMLAATAETLADYEGLNIVGPVVPTVREVITFLHDEYKLPLPHFSVPFLIAYPFAWLMERLDVIFPWEPLITRSIIHLLEEVYADNQRAFTILGFQPHHHWQDSIRAQMDEMSVREIHPMKLIKEMS
jgi:nucleoside-diphosphate-sugar epimerase